MFTAPKRSVAGYDRKSSIQLNDDERRSSTQRESETKKMRWKIVSIINAEMKKRSNNCTAAILILLLFT
jgi:hypothetical protein